MSYAARPITAQPLRRGQRAKVETPQDGKRGLLGRDEIAEYEQGQQIANKLLSGDSVRDREVREFLYRFYGAGQGESVDAILTRRNGSQIRVSKAPQRLPDSWQGIGNNVLGVLIVSSPIWILTFWLFWEVWRQL